MEIIRLLSPSRVLKFNYLRPFRPFVLLSMGLAIATTGYSIGWAQQESAQIGPENSVSAEGVQVTPPLYGTGLDRALTLHRIMVLPATDNMDGIYSQQIYKKIIDLIQSSHQLNYVEGVNSNSRIVEARLNPTMYNADALEENPQGVLAFLNSQQASVPVDALVSSRAVRSSKGISLKIDLFLASDGRLLLQESEALTERKDFAAVEDSVAQMWNRLRHKFPYDALILSRQGNRVTLNAGKRDGLKENQVLSVIQIVNITRHPRFDFMIKAEKETIGRVRIIQVDDALSFGAIESEREAQLIGPRYKVVGLSEIRYNNSGSLRQQIQRGLSSATTSESASGSASPAASVADSANSADVHGEQEQGRVDESASGEANAGQFASTEDDESSAASTTSSGSGSSDPREWVPIRPPSFGALGLRLGISNFMTTLALNVQPLQARSEYTPFVYLTGELWLNPAWTLSAALDQSIMSVKNPRTGSTPPQLNVGVSSYSFVIGRNVLLRGDYFGPKIQIKGGFSTHSSTWDTSKPVGMTSTTYSGLMLGLKGSVPVGARRQWTAGLGLESVLFARMRETPVTSGSAKSGLTSFFVSVDKKFAENIFISGVFEAVWASSSLSGRGTRANNETATSLTERQSRFSGGVTYMF